MKNFLFLVGILLGVVINCNNSPTSHAGNNSTNETFNLNIEKVTFYPEDFLGNSVPPIATGNIVTGIKYSTNKSILNFIIHWDNGPIFENIRIQRTNDTITPMYGLTTETRISNIDSVEIHFY